MYFQYALDLLNFLSLIKKFFWKCLKTETDASVGRICVKNISGTTAFNGKKLIILIEMQR